MSEGRPAWASNYKSMGLKQLIEEVGRINNSKTHIPDRVERLAYIATEISLKRWVDQ